MYLLLWLCLTHKGSRAKYGVGDGAKQEKTPLFLCVLWYEKGIDRTKETREQMCLH